MGYQKTPSDFQLVQWKIEHTALVHQVRAKLEAQGGTVALEAQNNFRLVGRNGVILAGTPDIIVSADGRGKIVDAKTGQPNNSDVAQVMIYMWAVPLAMRRYRDVKFDGVVAYKDHEVSIPNEKVDADFIAKVVDLIHTVTGNEPPRKFPSMPECGYCEITIADCTERMNEIIEAGYSDQTAAF